MQRNSFPFILGKDRIGRVEALFFHELQQALSQFIFILTLQQQQQPGLFKGFYLSITAARMPTVHKRQTQAPGVYWVYTTVLPSRNTKESEAYFKEVLGSSGTCFTSPAV